MSPLLTIADIRIQYAWRLAFCMMSYVIRVECTVQYIYILFSSLLVGQLALTNNLPLQEQTPLIPNKVFSSFFSLINSY